MLPFIFYQPIPIIANNRIRDDMLDNYLEAKRYYDDLHVRLVKSCESTIVLHKRFGRYNRNICIVKGFVPKKGHTYRLLTIRGGQNYLLEQNRIQVLKHEPRALKRLYQTGGLEAITNGELIQLIGQDDTPWSGKHLVYHNVRSYAELYRLLDSGCKHVWSFAGYQKEFTDAVYLRHRAD